MGKREKKWLTLCWKSKINGKLEYLYFSLLYNSYSGADISTVVSDAFLRPLKDLRGA